LFGHLPLDFRNSSAINASSVNDPKRELLAQPTLSTC
jgi:hypothetical protein